MTRTFSWALTLHMRKRLVYVLHGVLFDGKLLVKGRLQPCMCMLTPSDTLHGRTMHLVCCRVLIHGGITQHCTNVGAGDCVPVPHRRRCMVRAGHVYTRPMSYCWCTISKLTSASLIPCHHLTISRHEAKGASAWHDLMWLYLP